MKKYSDKKEDEAKRQMRRNTNWKCVLLITRTQRHQEVRRQGQTYRAITPVGARWYLVTHWTPSTKEKIHARSACRNQTSCNQTVLHSHKHYLCAPTRLSYIHTNTTSVLQRDCLSLKHYICAPTRLSYIHTNTTSVLQRDCLTFTQTLHLCSNETVLHSLKQYICAPARLSYIHTNTTSVLQRDCLTFSQTLHLCSNETVLHLSLIHI